MKSPVLERLAEAITALAGVRKRLPLDHLLRETVLNILILSRIASNRIPDRLRREEIESAADHLVTQLRHAAWDLPAQPHDAARARDRYRSVCDRLSTADAPRRAQMHHFGLTPCVARP